MNLPLPQPSTVLTEPRLALSVLAACAVAYLVIGLVNDVRRRLRAKLVARMQHDLAVVLFQPVPEAEAAARRLARDPQRALIDLVQRSATDLSGDADRRLRSLVATAGLGSGIRRRIRSRSWRVRAQGAALASLLPEGDPGRLSLLVDPHPLVRARAVESMEAESIVAHPKLIIVLLDDTSPAVRLAAQGALLRGGSPIVPALEHHLRRFDGIGIAYALEVASNLPDPRLLDVVTSHLGSPRAQCRAQAAKALGLLAPDSDELTGLLGDDAPEVRAAAAQAISRGGIEQRAADVGRLLRDPSWQVRRAAGLALRTMGPSGVGTLRVYAEDEDTYAREGARQVLATIEARTTVSVVGR